LAHSVTGDTLFDISLLVGADHYWDIVEDHVVRGNGPTAVKSKIGYLLSGPMPSTSHASADKHILNVLASRAPEHSILERFWSLENMGISPCEPDRKSVEYLQQYQATAIEYDNGRYHAKLPWKQDHPALPTNHNIALKRTVGAIQRLRNEPEVPRAHGDIIAEQERRGFIERVPLGQESAEQVHYIPHHPVEKESSTTPIRIVYDCSCRQSRDSPSLNDCLKSTPPALNELTSILTIVTEIEAVLNDRPLTYASTDLNDPAHITPSQLLYGRRVTTLPHDDVTFDAGSTVAAADHATFNRMARRRELLIQQLYRRWKTEYLTSLREHHRVSGSNTQTINTGDVVQIHDDGPRC